jgi:hypothetical protein
MLINKQMADKLLREEKQLENLIELANFIGIHDIYTKTKKSIERLNVYHEDHSELNEDELYLLLMEIIAGIIAPKITKFLHWDLIATGIFCAKLLEDVNAHDISEKVRNWAYKLLQK